MMPTATPNSQIAVCLTLTRAISRAKTLDGIYAAALDALHEGLGVSRASVLLFDPDQVMRFKASRGLSDAYRRAVEGHTPWTPDSPDPQPIVVADVIAEPSLEPYRQTLADEGIMAMAFIPLVALDRVIGKFMLYYDVPRAPTADALQLAGVIAAQVAFAVERAQAAAHAKRSEERLRFALDAALMGTWEWDLSSHEVRWSENLERIHGLPPGTFDATFQSYEREIHPDDRERVLASARRAIDEGVSHDVEYRIVAPDGTVRWVEGKGHVEYEDGKPVRMAGVCMVVSRRKEAELARLAAAEDANRLKDEFLATLSHELRTPLSAIVGWVQILEQGPALSQDRVRHAVEVIGRNAALQSQLIEDILDVTRIVAGKLAIERQPLLLPPLLDAVVSAVSPAANAKRIQLSREVPENLAAIEGDPKRLHQVLANILANAIKFTPEGGHVHVTCGVDAASILIEVRDSGIGIAADFLPFVFDRFRQADSRSARTHGGLGLGLAVARHLIDQHGGEIRASSDGPGCGTTISLRLPVAARAGSGPAASRIASAGTMEALMPPRMDGVKVLVVDDDKDSREFLVALFDQHGADVRQCGSAASTLDLLASTAVDLIVADLGMPHVDGYQLIQQVRQMGCRTPAIAVSAYTRPEDRARALAAGYNGYAPKPLETTVLLLAVDGVLKASAARAD